MNGVFNISPITGRIMVTDDNQKLNAVLASLVRNNTFVPNINKIMSVKKDKKVPNPDFDKNKEISEKNPKNIKVKKDVLIVSFCDDTWVEVTRSDEDVNDLAYALLYAITKRIFGKPTTGGYVIGNGFMEKIKDLVSSIKTEEDIEAEKEAKIKAKEEADQKAHEEAVQRHLKNPSIGYRMRSLEEKFDKILDKLGNIGVKEEKKAGRFFGGKK